MSQRCEICGTLEPRYVCRECGRRVCTRDFRSELWLCTICEPVTRAKEDATAITYSTGLSWISVASYVMIIIGFLLMVMASFTRGTPNIGGIILIGPIPIVLGGGTESTWLIILGAVVTAVALVALLFARRKTYR